MKRIIPYRSAKRPGYNIQIEYRKTRKFRPQLLEQAKNRCQRCGSPNDLCIDHILALRQGGLTVLENLQVLCRSCNSRKNAGNNKG